MHLPFTLAEPVLTARLMLRPFEPDDLEMLLAIHGDVEAVRYVPYPPRDRAAVAEVLGRKLCNRTFADEGDLIELAVVTRDADLLIGDLLLALRSVEHETLEVGYIFATAQGGQGYASEAVRALLDIAFGGLGARRVMARIDTRNTRSRKLAARIGMRLEAELIENEWFKGELTSEADYGVLAREWPSITKI